MIESHYYPFGMMMPGRKYVAQSPYRYGFNGKEDEVSIGHNNYDFGARIQDSRTGRWLSVDAHGNRYPNHSGYSAFGNNPINAIDPDGKDIILLIWAAGSGNSTYGHAAIAISNYIEVDGKMIKDGTYTYFDLGPGNPDGMNSKNFNKDVTPAYSARNFYYKEIADGKHIKEKITMEVLLNKDPSIFEKGAAADGVLKIESDFEKDSNLKDLLTSKVKDNKAYNGLTNNCSDLVAQGLSEATGAKHSIGLEAIPITPFKIHTPNAIWTETVNIDQRESSQKKPLVLKDPQEKVRKSMIEAIKDTSPKAAKQIPDR